MICREASEKKKKKTSCLSRHDNAARRRGVRRGRLVKERVRKSDYPGENEETGY